MGDVGKILDAIEKDKKISFSYGDYDEKKKIVLNGKEYRVSPYEFLYEEGKYYVMSQHEKEEDTEELRNFRVDLMREIKILNGEVVFDTCRITENQDDFTESKEKLKVLYDIGHDDAEKRVDELLSYLKT